MTKNGLFVGLITLDFIYAVTEYPAQNQKVVASNYTVAAGGPATNAAVTFSFLNNCAKLLGILGSHSITQLIQSDLNQQNIKLIDLEASRTESPPVSSIIVTPSTGNRAVISINALKAQAGVKSIPPNCLEDVEIVLVDGHQMAVSREIVELARQNQIPVVMDGGSWKPGFETVLPFVDYAICSANFYPPSCQNQMEIINYLIDLGIPNIAITHGEKPIQYYSSNQNGLIEVPQIDPVDTLGAGDVFHGAFCHFILQKNFQDALVASAQVAAQSCQSFGTRHWLT